MRIIKFDIIKKLRIIEGLSKSLIFRKNFYLFLQTYKLEKIAINKF